MVESSQIVYPCFCTVSMRRLVFLDFGTNLWLILFVKRTSQLILLHVKDQGEVSRPFFIRFQTY